MHLKSALFSIDENITPSQLKKIETFKIDQKKLWNFLDYCNANWIKSLVGDEIFLKQTKSLPYILYYIWNYEILKTRKLIWIVWPRKMDDFIKNNLEKFFQEISTYSNIAIVSGFAEWTDLFAHKLAIKYKIPTVAVLWFGFVKALNSSWRDEIIKISENGLVISEFKLKQSWTNRTFPQRNRIIAGLSDLLFVPSCAEKSWTLITIKDSLKLSKPVFSCFRNLGEEIGEWSNRLIAEKKVNWIYSMDIFFQNLSEILNLSKTPDTENLKKYNLSTEQDKIVQTIQSWKHTLEEICIDLQLENSEVIRILSDLELEWVIFNNSNDYFIC